MIDYRCCIFGLLLVSTVWGSTEETTESVQRLIRQLRGRDAIGRIAAANKLREIGEDAELAAEDLCQTATDESPRIAKAALSALEKVRPDLYPHVSTIILDESDAKKSRAYRELAEMKSKARPACSLMVAELKRNLAHRLNKKNKRNYFINDWQLITAIKQVDPEHAEFIKLVKQLAGKKNTGSKIRAESIVLLYDWAGEDSDRRKEVYTLLKDAINDEVCHEVCARIAGEYGVEAKSLLPMLTKLKLSRHEDVRKAAERAVVQIEATIEALDTDN